jgi:hypothetical protein
MTHYLPNDDARCNRSDCPRRETCLRYLCRNTGGEYARFAAFDPNHCEYYLPSEE